MQRQTQTERKWCEDSGKEQVASHGPPEATRGREGSVQTLPSQFSGGTDPTETLTSDFQPPELERTYLLFKQNNLWDCVQVALGNENLRKVVSIPGANVCKLMSH